MANIKNLTASFKNISWENLLKYKWVVPVILIFLVSKTVSDLFVTYIDHKLTPLTLKKEKLKPSTQLRPPDIRKILSVNIFNPSFTGMGAAPGQTFETATPTSLNIKLAGTIVFPDSKRSIADLIVPNEPEPFTVQESDFILNTQAKILKIEYERVYLLNMRTQGYEYVEIPREEEMPLSTTPTTTTVGIRPINETTYEISRDMIRDALSKDNIAKTITDASSRFEVVGGRIVGVHITSVRPGSFYEQLGIQRDDILEEVNGQKIDSLKAGSALFDQLKTNVDRISQPVTLSIIRNGQRINMTYNVK